MLALGARSPLMFRWLGGYRVLSLSTVNCALRDGSDALHQNADLVPRVLHGGLGAAGHRTRLFRVCGGTQLSTNNRYDAAPQESVHSDT